MTPCERSAANQLLKEALALAQADPRRALDLLQQGLTNARASADLEAVSSFARNAGLICVHTGDLHRGIGFYEEALSAAPDDAYLHFAYGDAQRRLGELEAASRAFSRSAELARQQGDEDMMIMASAALTALDDPR